MSLRACMIVLYNFSSNKQSFHMSGMLVTQIKSTFLHIHVESHKHRIFWLRRISLHQGEIALPDNDYISQFKSHKPLYNIYGQDNKHKNIIQEIQTLFFCSNYYFDYENKIFLRTPKLRLLIMIQLI